MPNDFCRGPRLRSVGAGLRCSGRFGLRGGDGASEGPPPVALDDVHDVEDHQAVRLAEVHLHGTLELRGVALVVLDVHAPVEGVSAQQPARVAAAALDAEVLARRDLAVGLVAVQAVAAAVFVERNVPVVVAVGVEIQQLGIAVVPVLGRRPVEILRGVVRLAGPVHAHLVVGGVPGPGVGAELQLGIDLAQLLARAAEEVVDYGGAPLDPLLEAGAVGAFPAAVAVLLPGVDILGEAFELLPDVGLEGLAREVREVGHDVVVAGAVEDDAVEVVLAGHLFEERNFMLLHLGQRRIGEEHRLAGDLQLRGETAARQVVDGLPFGMSVVDQAAAEDAVSLGEGVERSVDLHAGLVGRLGEGADEVEVRAYDALPLLELRGVLARVDHLARGALDVEHEGRHARLAALVHIVADRIGIAEALPVGRAVEPHEFGFHGRGLRGRLPASGACGRGKQPKGCKQFSFHAFLVVFVGFR